MSERSSPEFLAPYSLPGLLWRGLDISHKTLTRLNWRGTWRLRKQIQRSMQHLGNERYILYPYLTGQRVWVCPSHYMDQQVIQQGSYEREVQHIIRTFVDAGFSYIDIGANIGLHLVAAAVAQVAPDQLFYGFEPEPSMYAILQRNMAINRLSQVKLFPLALGDQPGQVSFHVSATANKGNHSLFADEARHGRTLSIEMRRLDDIFTATLPTLLKIDVEGAEMQVLQGAQKTLHRLTDAAIIIESLPEHLHRAGTTPAALTATLTGAGFALFVIEENGQLTALNSSPPHPVNVLGIKGSRAQTVTRLIS